MLTDMGLSGKLKGLLSLSAASAALLQGTVSLPANIPPPVFDRKEASKATTVTTDKLVLAPSPASTVTQFAGHSSHSSHSSHASHRSHYSSTGAASYYPAPSPAISYATPPSVPVPRPVATNSSFANTGSTTNTNQPVDQDTAMASRVVEFQKKQAAEGSAMAQYSLGIRYLTGDGVGKNVEKAKTLLEMSAEQGYSPAKRKLAELGAVR